MTNTNSLAAEVCGLFRSAAAAFRAGDCDAGRALALAGTAKTTEAVERAERKLRWYREQLAQIPPHQDIRTTMQPGEVPADHPAKPGAGDGTSAARGTRIVSRVAATHAASTARC
jgi:hypothetical protein